MLDDEVVAIHANHSAKEARHSQATSVGVDSKELESEAQPDLQVPCTFGPRGTERPVRSLVDPSWQSQQDRPVRAGWQQERERSGKARKGGTFFFARCCLGKIPGRAFFFCSMLLG